jgi:hypothetical protein
MKKYTATPGEKKRTKTNPKGCGRPRKPEDPLHHKLRRGRPKIGEKEHHDLEEKLRFKPEYLNHMAKDVVNGVIEAYYLLGGTAWLLEVEKHDRKSFIQMLLKVLPTQTELTGSDGKDALAVNVCFDIPPVESNVTSAISCSIGNGIKQNVLENNRETDELINRMAQDAEIIEMTDQTQDEESEFQTVPYGKGSDWRNNDYQLYLKAFKSLPQDKKVSYREYLQNYKLTKF